ncbi:MAG TPA: serine/threonine-protein kinase [Ktedonobacteraceae bacterium]|nr:serine/threonine-protein kinase [Ktedonobacteraceae bacterium]
MNPLQAGDLFGSYRLVGPAPLGRGGFAEVWLGEHTADQTKAAIKVLNVPLPTMNEQDKFLDEARHLRQLVHHHIVRLLDCGIQSQSDKPYLILEYAANGTLRKKHPKGSILPISTVLNYTKQIVDGLQYAHNTRIIHRDIKPENMLQNGSDTILLSDFGIALPGKTLPHTAMQDIMGTPGYVAPEQLDGHPALPSDQYALAVVIYEWLCGHLPFRGTPIEIRIQQQSSSPPPLQNVAPGISSQVRSAVEQVLFRALSIDVSKRFRSVKDFADALEQAVNNPQISVGGGVPNSSVASPAGAQQKPISPVSVNQGAGAGNVAGAMGGGINPVIPISPGTNTPHRLSPAGGGNNVYASNQSPSTLAQGQIVLPGTAGNGPFNPLNPFATPSTPGHNAPTQASLLSGSPSYNALTQAAYPNFNPFGSGGPTSPGKQTGSVSPKAQGKWFERQFWKQSKNRFFIYGGVVIDFILAVVLGTWLNAGDASWNLWLGSLLIAVVTRLLCASLRNRYFAYFLASLLGIYWGIGSWALGTVLHNATKLEPIPPHIIALFGLILALFQHIRYVQKKK